MRDQREAARVRGLLEEMAGLPLEDFDLAEAQRLLAQFGIEIDDSTQAAQLWAQWEAIQPVVLQAALDPEAEAFGLVEPVFQSAMDRLADRALDPASLSAEPAGVRAILATRIIEGMIDNGGWVAIFIEGRTPLLPSAIEGYRLLGLDEHARLASEAAERRFDPSADEEAEDADWTRFEDAWFALPSAELARAEYVRARPDVR